MLCICMCVQVGKNEPAAILQSHWSWLRMMGWDTVMDRPCRNHL